MIYCRQIFSHVFANIYGIFATISPRYNRIAHSKPILQYKVLNIVQYLNSVSVAVMLIKTTVYLVICAFAASFFVIEETAANPLISPIEDQIREFFLAGNGRHNGGHGLCINGQCYD